MPLPAVIDAVIYRGDSWAQEFRFIENDQPVNLTGVTVTSQARNRAGEVFDLDVTTDAAAGTVTISQNPVTLPAANYRYDIQFDDGGSVTSRVGGRLYVRRDVTAELAP